MATNPEGAISQWRRIRTSEKVTKRVAKLRAYPRRTRRIKKEHGR